MSRLLLASLLVLGLAGAAHAQLAYAHYGYAVPVVPVQPTPYTYFNAPGMGTYAVGPGYTYISNGVGTFQSYSPYAAQSYYTGRYATAPYSPYYLSGPTLNPVGPRMYQYRRYGR